MNTCPSDEQLNLFLEGNDAGAVGLHLRECTRCQQVLDRLSDDDGLRPATAPWDRAAWDWGETAELSPIVEALRNDTLLDGGRDRTGSRRVPFALDPSRIPGTLGSLGNYDVEEEIGRGGMGMVFRARDRTTGRRVALKVLFAGSDDERVRRRFLQEVSAAAKVEHDHIVRLYATSDPSDRIPYFVMEYVAGASLADAISSRGRIPPREAAELMAQVAAGIQAAHASGLVHSDVKPANILLDPVTGRAKVGDFGLARLQTETPGISREGILAGTPAYLSPEQARGETKPDPRSDIYSLGVTLYESLTGEPPFRGEPHRIIHQVLNDEPRPPRVFNDAVPRDLETICLKAMNKDASRRYASAGDLAGDLRHFLRGEPILARPAGSLERFWRWCRNNRRVAILTALVSLLLITLSVGSLLASISIYRARSAAIANAQRAEVQRGLAIDALTSLVQGIQDQLATRPGTLELRRSLLEIARTGLSKVPSSESNEASGEVDDRTIQALIRLGDIDLVLGRAADARTEFDQAARMAERVSSTNPKSMPLRRQLASAYDRLGDEISHTYSAELARDEADYREKAYAMRRALVTEYPEDSVLRRDLNVSQQKLANLRMKEGKVAAALKLYEESLASLKAEPVDGKNRAQILSDLRFTHSRIAGVALSQGRASEALAMHREALANAKDLCALDLQNVSHLRQLAFAFDYLGTTCTLLGELREAETALVAFRDNRQAAVTADPADQDALRSLALAYQHLGDLAVRRRDLGAARASFQQGLTRFEAIARRDPTSVMAFRDRMFALRKFVDLEAFAGRYNEAATWAQRELDAKTAKGVPSYPEHDAGVAEAQLIRDVYRLIDKCIDNPGLARAQQPKLATELLHLRAISLARSGRDAEAATAARELLAHPTAPYASLYAARAYAIAAASLGKSRPETKAEYVKAAVAALRQAIANSTVHAPYLRFEPEFEALRDDPDFIALTGPESNAAKP